MSSIKLAANLCFLFKDRPLLERFAAASTAGFNAVELSPDILDGWSKEQLLTAKEEAKVEVVSLTAQTGGKAGDKGLMTQPGRDEEFSATLDRAIEYAVALKCPNIHILAGIVEPSDVEAVERAEHTYMDNLEYAAGLCAKNGITVLIEPISTIPNYFLQHQQQALDILKKIHKPNVKIEFDTYHAQTLDGNLTMFLQKNMDYIGHIQVGQVPGRHEPDEKGEINFPFFFKTLAALGYDGWIGCEYVPAGMTEEGLHWAKSYLNVPNC